MAKVQRLVGIDFGTSTSIVKVKRYEGDRPVGDSHASSSVTFGNGESDSKAVTAVRLNRDGAATCGEEALDQIPGSTVCKEFKMDLEAPDREKRRQAMELTEDYFRYLYSWYGHQRSDLGAIGDEECTLVSYPVKWRPETREYLLETARNAGFRNVSGMDEPTAALYATLCRKMNEINQQGLLRAGESGYMMLVDMGAGTTDLAVCRYRVKAGGPVIRVDQIGNEIIATWPMDSGAATFGGREVDRVLEEYIIGYLVNCGFPAGNAEQAVRGSGNSSTAAKRWKETTVSKALNDGKRVESCAFVTPFMMFLPQAKPFPAFGRREFEAMLGEKVEDFKNLVAGCLAQVSRAEPELPAKKLDLVILTGGHSSWYFVEELLNGAMPGLSLPQLERVQQERSRVIRLTNPQETVALGLVYSRLPFQVAAPEPELRPEPERRHAQNPPVSSETIQKPPVPVDDASKSKNIFTGKIAVNTAKTVMETIPVLGMLGKASATVVGMLGGGDTAKYQFTGGAERPLHMPEKWPVNSQLALCAQEFFKECDQDLLKKINRGATARLRANLNIAAGDAVFVSHDDTVLFSGKNGFVFCTSGIINKGFVEQKNFISWLTFATGQILSFSERDSSMFCDSAGRTTMLISWTSGINDYYYAAAHHLLEKLQERMRTGFGLQEIPKQTVRTSTGGVTNEQLARSARDFIRSYDQSVIRTINRGEPQAIRKCLEIPAGSEVYLYHDDTLLQGGKEGFAVTDRGFYCCPGGGGGPHVPTFTDWETFFMSSLEVEPKQGCLLRRYDPIHDNRKPLAYFLVGHYAANAFVFIAHLHTHLRELYI